MRWFFVFSLIQFTLGYILVWHTSYTDYWNMTPNAETANPPEMVIAKLVPEEYRQPLALVGLGLGWLVVLCDFVMGRYTKKAKKQAGKPCIRCGQPIEDNDEQYCACGRFIEGRAACW